MATMISDKLEPIVIRLGRLSRYIIQEKMIKESIPTEYIDGDGFLRIIEYINYKRNKTFSDLKSGEVTTTFNFYEKYLVDNYPEYDALLSILAMLFKSIEVFYRGRDVWKGEPKLNIDEERKLLAELSLSSNMKNTFVAVCNNYHTTHKISNENAEVGNTVIKAVMKVSNDMYKTLKEQKVEKKIRITVNAHQVTYDKERISYSEVVHLAFKTPVTTVYTALFFHGPAAKPQGSLIENQTVEIVDGMSFVVALTNNA